MLDENEEDDYKTVRIDIKNFGTGDNNVIIKHCSDESILTVYPDWFQDSHGTGVVVHSMKGKIELEAKCIGNGEMRVFFRSKDCRGSHVERFPLWISITRLQIDNTVLFENALLVSHDQPFIHNLRVTDGQIVKIFMEWQKAVDILAKERENNIQCIDEMQQKIAQLQLAKAGTEIELENVKNGWSFKMGRMITYIPRKIRELLY